MTMSASISERSTPDRLDIVPECLDIIPEMLADQRRRLERPLELWRRMARLVRMLCGVCIALRKYAMEAGLMDSYMVAVTARTAQTSGENGEIEKLTFNVKDFKVNREVKVPRQLRNIMDKNPDCRSPDEVQAISRLMRDLPSFRKYTHDMQQLMSKIVRYMKCGKRRVVLRKGHIGYSVYFIYSGSVSVVLDKDEQSVFVKQEAVILRKGACFGEIALVQNTRRNATVVCAEDTEFLVVDKDDFVANGLHLQTEEETRARKDFLKRWSPLENWPDSAVSDLTYMSRTEDFNHNKVIVNDSRKNQWLWFVVKGSCEILRLVDLKKSPDYDRLVSLHSYGTNKYITNSTDDRARPMSAPMRSTRAGSGSGKLRPKTGIGIKTEDENTSPDGVVGIKGNSIITKLMMNRGETEKLQDAMRLIMMGKRLTRNKPEEDPIQTGIYVRVDTLRDGHCFGLEGLFDDLCDEHPPRFSMVSKGCTVVHFPKAKFMEMADDETLESVRSQLKEYPSDVELCSRFLSKSEWDFYKHGLVESVIADRQNSVTFENSLRNCQQAEYGARFELDQMTHQFYTPMTSRTHSPMLGSFTVPEAEMNKIKSNRLKSAVESRRPKTALFRSPPSDRDKQLKAEANRLSNVNTEGETPRKHKVWAEKMKEYTTQKSRPPTSKARLLLPASSRPQSAVTSLSRSKSQNLRFEPDLSMSRSRSRTNETMITLNTKPVIMDQHKKPSLVLAQPSRC